LRHLLGAEYRELSGGFDVGHFVGIGRAVGRVGEFRRFLQAFADGLIG